MGQQHDRVHSINHLWTPQIVWEAYGLTRRDGALGIDQKSFVDFGKDISVADLLDECKQGLYRAPAVRRAYIPKGTTEKRPLGIPTFTDKVLQRSILMLLEPLFEQIFYDCSYGFRPNRSAHMCVRSLRECMQKYRGGVVLDMDIRKYFDSIPKNVIREFVAQRVQDGVVNRMIGKWLNAGVMENGEVSYSDIGTPQGGVISPFLANIYLHHVLDDWFHKVVIKHLRGRAELFRYADDFVIVCERMDDAERILSALHKRMNKFGLSIHEDKSKLVDLRITARDKAPRSFDFLGFTFYWGKSRNKRPLVRVKTAKDRFARSCNRLWTLCRTIQHQPLEDQAKRLNRTLRGHYNYYGVSFNQRAVWTFRYNAHAYWRYWLDRRSQKRKMPWTKFSKVVLHYPLAQPIKMIPLWNQPAAKL